jgi:hypothetical protein
MRPVGVIVAVVAMCALAIAPDMVRGHTFLDPEVAHAMLVEIADYQNSARSERNPEPRAEALFKLGGRVQALVDLLDQDAAAHDGASPLALLLVKRLEVYEITIAYSEQSRRFSYDQGAFRQYLKLAPRGPHAAEARFQILSETFHATLTAGPDAVAPADRPAVASAVEDEEQFLRDYPKHPKAKEVRFFLGVDCHRLSRNVSEPEKVVQYERCARHALERVAEEYPGSIEARASSALLETMSSARPR